MQAVREEKMCVADLEVGDIFFHGWDRRWVRNTTGVGHGLQGNCRKQIGFT